MCLLNLMIIDRLASSKRTSLMPFCLYLPSIRTYTYTNHTDLSLLTSTSPPFPLPSLEQARPSPGDTHTHTHYSKNTQPQDSKKPDLYTRTNTHTHTHPSIKCPPPSSYAGALPVSWGCSFLQTASTPPFSPLSTQPHPPLHPPSFIIRH